MPSQGSTSPGTPGNVLLRERLAAEECPGRGGGEPRRRGGGEAARRRGGGEAGRQRGGEAARRRRGGEAARRRRSSSEAAIVPSPAAGRRAPGWVVDYLLAPITGWCR